MTKQQVKNWVTSLVILTLIAVPTSAWAYATLQERGADKHSQIIECSKGGCKVVAEMWEPQTKAQELYSQYVSWKNQRERERFQAGAM